MKLWDKDSKQRMGFLGLGLALGLAVLLKPQEPEVKVLTVTKTVTQVVEKEVVKYKTQFKDRTVTIDKPSGEKIVIVEKSGSDSSSTSKTKDNLQVVNKTESTTHKDTKRCSLGIEYNPLAQRFNLTGHIRLGNLPLWATASVGDVPITGLPIYIRLTTGVRYEF